VQLEPGDRVLLYTDGMIEGRSPTGDFYGLERVVELLVLHLAEGLAPPEVMRRVMLDVVKHQQGHLVDDASLMLVQWRREGAPADASGRA
jgi:serine phosphatase RsbU (regulator of sigma subunit)